MKGTDNMKIKVSDIKVNEGRRSIDYSKVKEIAESIKEIGLINPVTITKDNVLIAGMHRLEAAKLLNIAEIECNILDLDKLRAEMAEIDENLIRNELHYIDRGLQLDRRKSIYEELHPEAKQGMRNGQTSKNAENSFLETPSFTEDTSKKIGKSQRTVEVELQIAKDIIPEVQEIIKQNNITKTDALKIARLEPEQQSKIAEKINEGASNFAEATRNIQREKILEKVTTIENRKVEKLEGKYDVIVIDPPWPMQKIERDLRPNQTEFDYPTMSEKELSELHIPSADDCHMWVWTTHKFMPMAFGLLEKWGFKYICTFVWHKPGGFQPYNLPQFNCEFALYAHKGSPKFIDTKAFNVCFNAQRGVHSEKPEEFYDTIKRVTAGKRIDIFNRRKIIGFDRWGKEVE